MSWASAINDPHSGEIILPLIRLSHDDWPDDLRLVANVADVVSNGETFVAAGFEIAMPDQAPDRPATLRFRLVDADASTLALLRATNDAITVAASWVLASDPDTVHAGPFAAEISAAEATFGVISGELTVYPVLEEVANAGLRFTIADYPGIW